MRYFISLWLSPFVVRSHSSLLCCWNVSTSMLFENSRETQGWIYDYCIAKAEPHGNRTSFTTLCILLSSYCTIIRRRNFKKNRWGNKLSLIKFQFLLWSTYSKHKDAIINFWVVLNHETCLILAANIYRLRRREISMLVPTSVHFITKFFQQFSYEIPFSTVEGESFIEKK